MVGTNPSNSNLEIDEAINLFYKSKNTTSRVPSCNIINLYLSYQHEVRHYVPTVIVGTYTNWGYSYSTFTLTTTGTYMVCLIHAAQMQIIIMCLMVTTHEDVYDAFKITNELTGKALCVYNKLNSSSSGFADAIKNLTQSFLLVI
jgi:hypothetical protein